MLFHTSTLVWRRSKIEMLRGEDGGWVCDKKILKDMVSDFYSELFKADPESRGDFIIG